MIKIVEQEFRHCRNMTGCSNVLGGSGSNPPSIAGGYGDSRVDISDSMVIGRATITLESGCYIQETYIWSSSDNFPYIFLLMG